MKSPGFFKLGSCFSFFLETFNFFIFLFLCVFYFFIILYNKNKVFLFHLYIYFLFGCKFEVWRKKTHLILFQVGFFFNIYKFYFFLFFTLYLVSSFLEILVPIVQL